MNTFSMENKEMGVVTGDVRVWESVNSRTVTVFDNSCYPGFDPRQKIA